MAPEHELSDHGQIEPGDEQFAELRHTLQFRQRTVGHDRDGVAGEPRDEVARGIGIASRGGVKGPNAEGGHCQRRADGETDAQKSAPTGHFSEVFVVFHAVHVGVIATAPVWHTLIVPVCVSSNQIA